MLTDSRLDNMGDTWHHSVYQCRWTTWLHLYITPFPSATWVPADIFLISAGDSTVQAGLYTSVADDVRYRRSEISPDARSKR